MHMGTHAHTQMHTVSGIITTLEIFVVVYRK